MTALKRSGSFFAATLLFALCACNSGSKPAETANVPADTSRTEEAVPAYLSYDVVKEYPHDPAAFTEGLEYHDGFIYESVGEYGQSDIRKTNLEDGKVIRSQKLDKQYFGEGLTLLNGKLYQLTYKEGKGFVYDPATLKLERTFTFTAPEGWGMTNNGAQLIYDDGSNLLHYLDAHTFKEVKTLAVTDEHGPVNNINELELVDGFIYANIWQTDLLIKIDTVTGHVVARADLSALRQRGIGNGAGRRGGPEALNGIAWDAAGKRLFVTGKNWSKIFQIKLGS